MIANKTYYLFALELHIALIIHHLHPGIHNNLHQLDKLIHAASLFLVSMLDMIGKQERQNNHTSLFKKFFNSI